MLKSLLVKDIRLLSRYLILGGLLTVLGYGMGYLMTSQLPEEEFPSSHLGRMALSLSGGSIVALWLGMFGLALVAGNAFTAERMDRSALFLDYMPPTRRQILYSKLLVVVGFTILVFAIAITANLTAWSLTAYVVIPERLLMKSETIFGICKIMTCVTGASFAISSIAKSNGAPILVGLFSPLIVLSLVKSLDYALDLPVAGDTLFPRLCNACLVLGLGAFAVGCRWFVGQRYETG